VFQGRVARINQEGDTVTRELEVDVTLEKLPEPLVMGEEGEVDIDTGRHTAPVVPLSAIIAQNGSKGVLVAERGLLRFQKITPGLQDGTRAAVLAGLKEGDLVAINPAGLMPGKNIRPKIGQAAPGD
jgi:multidrug efflux pump subunit AcrA (membrane-fusion protein)